MKRERESGQKSQVLPINVESATRGRVQRDLASWDENILKRRASRLGVSATEAAIVEAKPLFMVEAERRAEEENRTVESILEEYSNRLRQVAYPGPDCFRPDEVAEYAEGGLSTDRRNHANTCTACFTLLTAAMPVEAAADDLVAALNLVDRNQDLYEPAAAASPTRHASAIMIAKTWAGVVLLPAIALLAAYLLSLGVDKSATRLTFLHDPLSWGVALVAAVLTLSLFELNRKSPLLRSVVAGAAAAAVACAFFLVDFRRSQSSRDMAVKYTQDQVESLVVDSIQNHRSTGKFIDASQKSDLIRLETANISSNPVRYVATGKELPGKVVADIGDHGGDLKWEYGDKVMRRLELLTGTVENNPEGLAIRALDGRAYNLRIAGVSVDLSPGTHVLAAVDPNTASIQSVRVIPQPAGKAASAK